MQLQYFVLTCLAALCVDLVCELFISLCVYISSDFILDSGKPSNVFIFSHFIFLVSRMKTTQITTARVQDSIQVDCSVGHCERCEELRPQLWTVQHSMPTVTLLYCPVVALQACAVHGYRVQQICADNPLCTVV